MDTKYSHLIISRTNKMQILSTASLNLAAGSCTTSTLCWRSKHTKWLHQRLTNSEKVSNGSKQVFHI